jgi:hypothetical protein
MAARHSLHEVTLKKTGKKEVRKETGEDKFADITLSPDFQGTCKQIKVVLRSWGYVTRA